MGRGRSKIGGAAGSAGGGKEVDFDKWGPMLDNEPIRDKNGDIIGDINDEVRYDYAEDIRSITKKEILEEIDAWRDDSGTYGDIDGDVRIYFAYKDGSFIDAEDLNGKKYKKAGLSGAYINTGDYEMAWGYEVMNDGRHEKIQTWSLSGEDGYTNSYSGYKAVTKYKVRVKTTYNNPNGKGGYKAIHETIRRSKKVPVE